MSFHSHLEHFNQRPIVLWEGGDALDLSEQAYRIATGYDHDEEIDSLFASYLAATDAADTTTLVIGQWASDSDDEGIAASIRDALIAAAPQLPKLEALFFGDIVGEENELSWIHNTNLAPLLMAYPNLKTFGTRGGQSLRFEGLSHAGLQSLTVQTGGLDQATLQDIAAASLPSLTRLELWLGTEEYGASFAIEDLQPIVQGQAFPQLKHLALCNSDQAAAVLAALAGAPVLAQLESLDLSMGTLIDAEAEGLFALTLPALKTLNLRRNYLSEDFCQRLQSHFSLELNVSEQEAFDEDDDYRYVECGE
jgi:hypothetical protein